MVSKDAMISGWNSLRPVISFDHNLSNGSFILSDTKTLKLDNIDIVLSSASNKNIFEGSGKVEIISVTKIK